MAPFAPFEPRPHLAVAVSGGRDSMALALLAYGWAKARAGRITALIVDHGLRPESAAEARQTRLWLRRRGIPGRVLAWTGAKPARDVQAAARRARYALLEEACRRDGVLHLLLAHQRDDQAETLLLRLGRGSGLAGLAAMPAVAERTHLRVLRPLLYVPRDRLTATLAAAGQAWIDDPGNSDPSRARARLRAALPALGADEMAVARLARTAAELGRARAALDAALAGLAADAVRVHPAGFLRLDLAALRRAPAELRLRLLAAAVAAIGGTPVPARAQDLARLWDQAAYGAGRARTLGGCLLAARADELLVMREPAAAGGRLALRAGAVNRWDERFSVEVGHRLSGRLCLARLGERARPRAGLALPRAVLAALPAVWAGHRLLAVPHLSLAAGPAGRRALGALRLAFAPPRPLAPAPFGIV